MSYYSLVKNVKNTPWMAVTNCFFLFLNKQRTNGCRFYAMNILKYESFTVL